ncbi:unnamed protein product [Dicrocoelium dendriticum]|nr:unnamed protein product [Dicrocoelium dendriticum]
MVVLYDFTESMKSQISIRRGELVRLLGYSPAGDWSEVETSGLAHPALHAASDVDGNTTAYKPTSQPTSDNNCSRDSGTATNASSTNIVFTGANSNHSRSDFSYRRGWVPTSYLAPANVFSETHSARFIHHPHQRPLPLITGPILDAQGNVSAEAMRFNCSLPSSMPPPVAFHHPENVSPNAIQSSAQCNPQPNVVDISPVGLHGPTLSMYPWYHGAVSRQAGEQLLRVGITGSFLVRASESAPGQLSVTVRHLGRVYHYRINQDPRGLFYITNVHRFPTVVQLIDHHSRSADGLVCPLLYPVPKHPAFTMGTQQAPYSSIAAHAIPPPAAAPGAPDPPSSSMSHPHSHLTPASAQPPIHPGQTDAPQMHQTHFPVPNSRANILPASSISPVDGFVDDFGRKLTLDEWEIDRSEIVTRQKLGCGQYGDVYEAVWKRHNVVVAVKTLKQEVNVNDFLKEAAIMKKLRHRNLVQLLGELQFLTNCLYFCQL